MEKKWQDAHIQFPNNTSRSSRKSMDSSLFICCRMSSLISSVVCLSYSRTSSIFCAIAPKIGHTFLLHHFPIIFPIIFSFHFVG